MNPMSHLRHIHILSFRGRILSLFCVFRFSSFYTFSSWQRSKIAPFPKLVRRFIEYGSNRLSMNWSEEQRKLIEKYKSLDDIPVEERQYKCHTCHYVVEESPCPSCGEMNLEIMCPLDHCHCSHTIVERIEYCPICGQPICPECGSHDVSQVSRVTGYLADVSGWNAGKKQELKDRAHYTVA